MTNATERRTPQENRIPFDAFVEVGGLTGETFKARAIDVSAGGIHLQATRLPEIGTPLSCRFDSASDTVVCEGEVVWRRKTLRGGEFGMRFRSLDTESERVLRELCQVDHELGAGARVRLHLKGLSQPLHARVVERSARGVVTASELAFLRAGTECSLEDRESDTRSSTTLQNVAVRLDPHSGSPELTVTMDWASTSRSAQSIKKATIPMSTTSAVRNDASTAAAPKTRPLYDDKTPIDSVPPVACDDDQDNGQDDALNAYGNEQRGASNGPSVAPLSLSMSPDEEDDLAWREQLDTLMSGVRRVRDVLTRKGSEPRKAAAQDRPRRVTAAPPQGALHSEGRHVLRRQSASKTTIPDVQTTPAEWVAQHKRQLALGSAVGLSVLLGAFALTRGDSTAVVAMPASELAAAAAAPVSGASGVDVVQSAPIAPGAFAAAPSDDPSAAVAAAPYAVPGGIDTSATPWAQGAQGIPAAPAPPAAPYPAYTPPAAASMQNAWIPTTPVASLPSPRTSEPDVETRPASSERQERSSTPRKHHAVHSFGQGSVASGKTLRLHMNGPIEQIQGEHTPTGFTVDLPNVRATEAAGPLASSDPRIESIRVRNTDKRAELVVEFKDGVPNYLVRAKNDVLEIVLADKPNSSANADSDRAAPRILRKPTLERVRTRSRSRR